MAAALPDVGNTAPLLVLYPGNATNWLGARMLAFTYAVVATFCELSPALCVAA
jgi:hypothetical protein